MRSGRTQPSCSQLLRSFLNIDRNRAKASKVPLYLCPAAARACSTALRISSSRATTLNAPNPRLVPLRQTRRSHAEAAESRDDVLVEPILNRDFPVQCHGCGALSQTVAPNEPGYYDLNRRAVKLFLGLEKEEPRGRSRPEDEIVQASLQSLSRDKLAEIGADPELFTPKKAEEEEEETTPDTAVEPETPLCDRCHNLVHHHTGKPIFHPTIDAIRETIEESPYKYNHVYHVLDAADFPMSLLPRVHQLLDLMPLRTKNRRQRGGKFFRGKRTEMSFIITRSDLLAPKKEAVDRMMPYVIETLREALPRDSRHVRLGNVRCVSAKRSWWTKELKEDIWKRGGAGWMVGKVNVGKSQLFQSVFPKGRMDWKESKHDISVAMQARGQRPDRDEPDLSLPDLDGLDEGSLLPPPQPETNYPQMPVVSALPGTTASPIRVPFGGGKGELIDLPGLARSDLDTFVREEHRPSLIMKARITPEQQVIKPGQSLLIGGFIRITPRTPDLIFLGYAFTPIEAHLTATDKAIDIQNHKSDVKVVNIAVPGITEKIKLAGSFQVRYDVTKKRAGPITNKHAAGIKVDQLPYRVLSTDILIEGCGWVEITVQVRTKDLFRPKPKPSGAHSITVGGEQILQSLDLSDLEANYETGMTHEDGSQEPNWPVVDVFSPLGRFIGSRPPMNAWLYNKIRKTAATSKKRPRKSMRGAKKSEKQFKRSKA